MTAYASLPELKAYLGNFVSNDSSEPEFADERLQSLLDDKVTDIKAVWDNRFDGLTLPTPAGTIASNYTWLDLILELLNLESVASEILLLQAVRKFRISSRQAEIYQNLANWRWKQFALGFIEKAILAVFDDGLVFDTTPFVESDDRRLASQSPGLTITAYTNPSLDQTERFSLRESAFIRAAALTQGFVTTISDLNAAQLRPYEKTLVALVAPQIARINLSYDPNATAVPEYNQRSLLDGNPANCYSAINLVNKLVIGREYLSLIPRE